MVGGRVDFVEDAAEGNKHEAGAGTLTTSGTNATLSVACPAAKTTTSGYSASGNTFTMLSPNGAGQIVAFTFQR